MRKLSVWLILISASAYGQYFEQDKILQPTEEFFEEEPTEEQVQPKSLNEVIFGETEDAQEEIGPSTFFRFSGEDIDEYEEDEPEQGEDAGNPADPAPIDDLLFLLPMVAALIAYRFLYPNKKESRFKQW